MPELVGEVTGSGHRFAVVVSRFNSLVTERLLAGAMGAFARHGVPAESVDVAWVPGSVEIPVAAHHQAASGTYGAIVTLGAVVRGDTAHFDYVCQAVTSGVTRVALDTGVPVVFGVLTTDTMEQALDRAGGKAGNKGAEAAVTAIEMANLVSLIASQGPN
ncbi:MAG TPA: 6,7-dimethyl-8-ribityllumazine synthase [Trueperaceae bacterium]|nr:6,7-dimethyl-8-ribityllumazine synthase [Trueperaceae bacterium]